MALGALLSFTMSPAHATQSGQTQAPAVSPNVSSTTVRGVRLVTSLTSSAGVKRVAGTLRIPVGGSPTSSHGVKPVGEASRTPARDAPNSRAKWKKRFDGPLSEESIEKMATFFGRKDPSTFETEIRAKYDTMMRELRVNRREEVAFTFEDTLATLWRLVRSHPEGAYDDLGGTRPSFTLMLSPGKRWDNSRMTAVREPSIYLDFDKGGKWSLREGHYLETIEPDRRQVVPPSRSE
jgi:hypothetical protein